MPSINMNKEDNISEIDDFEDDEPEIDFEAMRV